jgi:transposase
MTETHLKVVETFNKIKDELHGYIELRFSNGSWCVRRATSVWNKKEKKVQKLTEHLGVISIDGTFTKKIPRNAIIGTNREIFEYGNGTLAYHYLKDIEKILNELTPYSKEIIAYSIIKAIDSKPLKLLASRWEKLYLSKKITVSLSPKHISSILNDIGTDVSSWYELFSRLSANGDIVIYDLSKIFTYSENIKIAEKGYNSKYLYLNQIGVTMAFSSVTQLPIGIEVFPGSMKETKIIRDFRKRFPKTDMGYIFDRGFTDYTLLDELREDNTRYIIPLKKDSDYMDFRWVRWNGPFVYRNRRVLWSKKKSDYGYIYFFDDPKVRGEQETALLKHVEKGEITLKEFQEKRKLAGIIGMLSDLDKEGDVIYDLYKGREDVELAFDALNNAVDSDKTYLRSEESVRGYYFVSFIALRVYFSILKRLREEDLTSKISVEEVLFELSKVEKIVEKNGKEYFAKVPKRTSKIMKLFPERFITE